LKWVGQFKDGHLNGRNSEVWRQNGKRLYEGPVTAGDADLKEGNFYSEDGTLMTDSTLIEAHRRFFEI
jgi:hypothetical protein